MKTTDRPPGHRLPPWAAPCLFAALTIFLFRDFIFSDRMLWGGDTLAMGYVVRELYAEALRTLGHVPLWAPHILGGTPFLEALSAGDSLYPPSVLLLLITAPHRALGWKLVLHIFLAGVFFFGWVRAIGGSRSAALLGGTAYLLAPFLIGFVHPGHDGKIFVTALAPLLFWATERHFQKPGPGTFASIGLVVALVLFTTHFQMAYFLFGAVGLYAIFRAIRVHRIRADASTESPGRHAAALRFVLFLSASVVGAAGAAYQFFPAAEYVTTYSRRIQTTREAAGQAGEAWSSSFSMHPEEAMSLLIPEFAGNQAGQSDWATNSYWGRNGLKDNHEYTGLVILLLAAVSFMGAARRPLRLFFTGLGLLALAFALGAHTPVWRVFYELVPGIRLFRAPGMVVYLFGFSAITLAALGLDRILDARRDDDVAALAKIQKVLLTGTGVMGLMALLAASGALSSFWTTVVYPTISDGQRQLLTAQQPFIARGASLAFLLAAVTSGVVWGFARRRLPAPVAVGALVLLVAVDDIRVDLPFIQTFDFASWAAPDPNIQAILEREQGGEPFRLWSLVRASQDDTPAMHGIELAAGHHPNDLSRYRELIGMVGSGDPANLYNTNVRRILNVRYILWPDIERGPAPQGPIVSRTQYGGGQAYHTLLADNGLPRARLVASSVVKSDPEAVPYIISDAHDPETEVVLAEEPPVSLPGGVVEGSVTWDERTADRMSMTVVSDRPALLVVADNWFPAWHAAVDGTETEVLRAYHTLRAVAVPAGTSNVTMWYQSDLLDRSRLISVLVLLGLLVLAGYGAWKIRPNRSAGEAASP